ncbi:peroxiredoxin family protein [Maribacter sp. 2304DJ31-5]|uniref:peroxiredoxin family protein n=1 Tax=Maribacter sp. 2304DJ31-5 TaxID=3386273 RepID=UPI0039BCEA91
MSDKGKGNRAVKASELNIKQWVDARGNRTEPIKLSDFEGKFKVLFCFQSWCSGCHSKGFPDLKQMVNALKDNENIVFLAVQTVFEGHHANTYEEMVKAQNKYRLEIPFGHDDEHHGKLQSNIMTNYQTGGTPWFIFIDKHNNVVFSDFHLNPEAAITFLKAI